MSMGMIFECGPNGPDKLVCSYLAEKINPDIKITPKNLKTLGNKKLLIQDCGITAKLLTEEGCGKVIIIWDLDKSPCQSEDRVKILESLNKAEVELSKVFFVCIKKELESWLLADESAIYSFLSKKTNHIIEKINKIPNPEHDPNPKKKLNRIIKERNGIPYDDKVDAKQIIELADIKKIGKRCSSFQEFEKKVKI